MAEWDAEEIGVLLARRGEFLEAVRDSPKSKPTLVEEHDVSRSTVDRAVRDLESEGFLDRQDGSVRLTLKGRLAHDAYREFTAALDGLDEAALILDTLPADASFSVELLRGAEVIESEPHAPHRPLTVLDDVLAEASTLLTYSTMVLPELVSRYRNLLVDDICTVELVASPPVVDVLVSDYDEQLDESIRSGNLELYETNHDSPGYSIVVAELDDGDWVGVTLHGDRGVTGVLKNDRPAAVEWLLDRYKELRNDAERLA